MWSTRYLIHNITIDQAAEELAELLGVSFTPRSSHYVGIYYRYRERPIVIDIKLNWIDDEDGELVHPDLPEGPFLAIATPEENPYRDLLNGKPNYEHFWTREF